MFDKYSVIDMFGPVYGENWHKAEIRDGLTFRWTGPGRTSSLRIPTMGASEVRLRRILAFAPADHELSDIQCTVDGREAPVRWAMKGSYATLWSDVKLRSASPTALATLTAPTRPASEDADVGKDARTIGLAINRVEIFALDTALIGAQAQATSEKLMDLKGE